jgi:hypothetical protein
MRLRDIGIILALVVYMFAISRLGRRRGDDSRSAKLMKKYKTLTSELLADTPDYELVEAVVAHVLADAAESRKPDPLYTLSKKPQPYMVVYSVWAVCKELAHGDYAALSHTATREMVEPACDGLPVIGAAKTAAALTALAEAHKAQEDTAEAEHAFHAAVEQECPLALCVTYIRDHIAELMGEEPAEQPAPAIEDTTDGE